MSLRSNISSAKLVKTKKVLSQSNNTKQNAFKKLRRNAFKLIREVEDPSQLFSDWDMIQFEEDCKGWAFISNAIRRKDDQSKLWKLVKKINRIKEQYNAIINATKDFNKSQKRATFKKNSAQQDSFVYKTNNNNKQLRFEDEEILPKAYNYDDYLQFRFQKRDSSIPVAMKKLDTLKKDLISFNEEYINYSSTLKNLMNTFKTRQHPNKSRQSPLLKKHLDDYNYHSDEQTETQALNLPLNTVQPFDKQFKKRITNNSIKQEEFEDTPKNSGQKNKLKTNNIKTLISYELEQLKDNNQGEKNNTGNAEDFIEKMKSKFFSNAGINNTNLTPSNQNKNDSQPNRNLNRSKLKIVKVEDQLDINVQVMTRDIKNLAAKVIEKQLENYSINSSQEKKSMDSLLLSPKGLKRESAGSPTGKRKNSKSLFSQLSFKPIKPKDEEGKILEKIKVKRSSISPSIQQQSISPPFKNDFPIRKNKTRIVNEILHDIQLSQQTKKVRQQENQFRVAAISRSTKRNSVNLPDHIVLDDQTSQSQNPGQQMKSKVKLSNRAVFLIRMKNNLEKRQKRNSVDLPGLSEQVKFLNLPMTPQTLGTKDFNQSRQERINQRENQKIALLQLQINKSNLVQKLCNKRALNPSYKSTNDHLEDEKISEIVFLNSKENLSQNQNQIYLNNFNGTFSNEFKRDMDENSRYKKLGNETHSRIFTNIMSDDQIKDVYQNGGTRTAQGHNRRQFIERGLIKEPEINKQRILKIHNQNFKQHRLSL